MTRRRKGTGTIEATEDGRFRARFPFAEGRSDVGVYATHAEAARALDAIVAELFDAGASPRAGLSLRVLGERCLTLRRRDGYRSIGSEENRWKVHLASWELASAAAASITRADVRDWLSGLARKGLAAQTRKNALNLLRAVLEHGVESELLEANVARDIRVKDRGSTKERSTWLTLQEADRLIDAAQDPAVELAIYTGLRLGELRALEWSDVHPDRIVVRFGAPGKPPKNGKIRHVPLLPQARATLDRMPRLGRLVFQGRDGDLARWRLVGRADWAQWLVDAEITRRVRWHDLRHTCATLLLSGAWGHAWSTEAVRELLGHSSVKVTERYARALGSLSATAAGAMRAAESQARNKPGTPQECAAQVLRTIGAPPAGIGPATFGLGNPLKPRSIVGLPQDPGSGRAYAVRALEAVAAGDPTALRQCVDALALVVARPATSGRRRAGGDA